MDENKIEEMRQVIQNASCKGIECEKCWLKNSPTCVCVKALYNEGYRKESDTAREILDMIDGVPTNEVNELNHLRLLKNAIVKRYGVDLTEDKE